MNPIKLFRRRHLARDPLRGLTDSERALVERVRPFTMTSVERILATIDSVTHVVEHGLPGDLVECGVWRGGSALAMILQLQQLGVDDREIVLFDTFEGMTAPTGEDTSAFDAPAVATWRTAVEAGARPWAGYFAPEVFSRDQVEATLHATGYPSERIRLVAGPVEETLPEHAPSAVSVLRLDTDWYTSTRHELEHLYPALVPGGILMIDDYGHWNGCRKAVDEYFADRPGAPFLARIDYTGRIAVKP